MITLKAKSSQTKFTAQLQNSQAIILGFTDIHSFYCISAITFPSEFGDIAWSVQLEVWLCTRSHDVLYKTGLYLGFGF